MISTTAQGSESTTKLYAMLLACWLMCTCFGPCTTETFAQGLPEHFVYVEDVIPGIAVDLRYGTERNFLGRPVDGYLKSRCILTKKAAQALAGVQEDCKRFGLGLKIFDAYRPQRAVDNFVQWGRDLADTKMKSEYYPKVQKKDLFKEGYIAEKSSHSRGSTVDLTIVLLGTQAQLPELDMGTPFDFFGPESWPDTTLVSPLHRAHRMLLRVLMEKHGFNPYDQEWWHFTLKGEPFPDTYFDFPVQ